MIVPGLLTGLTLALGIVRLGNASIWLDEAASVNLARIPFGDFLSVAADKEANGSLYYLLLRLWLWLGHSEFAIRLLSALAAAATIPVLYALAARLFGRRVAVIACALCALSGLFLRYAHEARGYSLAAFFATLLSLLLVRALQAPTRRRWIVYGAVAGLGLYAHFFVGFVILAHLIVAVVARRDAWRAMAAGWAVLAAIALPLGIFLLGQQGAQVAWIPRTTLRTVVPTFKALTGFGGAPLLIAYFVACAAGSAAVWRGGLAPRWKGGLVLAWVAVPPALAFAVSLATPIVRPQYLIVIVPGLSLLAALGLDAMRAPPAIAAATAALAAVAVAALPGMYSNLETHDWRGATRFVLSSSAPTDGVVFYAYYGWTP
ncbi:MAG: glycosyltransferase family 39 protein, partial [Actinomycetota bacterium]